MVSLWPHALDGHKTQPVPLAVYFCCSPHCLVCCLSSSAPGCVLVSWGKLFSQKTVLPVHEHAAKIDGQREAFSLPAEVSSSAVSADSQDHYCWQAHPGSRVLTPSSLEQAQPEPCPDGCPHGWTPRSLSARLCQHLTTLTTKVPFWLASTSHMMSPKPNGSSSGSSYMWYLCQFIKGQYLLIRAKNFYISFK